MFKLTKDCPNTILIHNVENQPVNYSDYGTAADAWAAESTEPWVKEYESVSDAKDDFYEALTVFTKVEVLKAARKGYTWPLEFGFVEEIEGEED